MQPCQIWKTAPRVLQQWQLVIGTSQDIRCSRAFVVSSLHLHAQFGEPWCLPQLLHLHRALGASLSLAACDIRFHGKVKPLARLYLFNET